jgi:hypothetical protein
MTGTGTGKSFLFFTYSYVSNFKVRYLVASKGNKDELNPYGSRIGSHKICKIKNDFNRQLYQKLIFHTISRVK